MSGPTQNFRTGDFTHAELQQFFIYEPDTGLFRSRIARVNSVPVGAVVGTRKPDGYVTFSFKGHMHLAHRLAWFYVHGKWPAHFIDHIDGDTSNNRIANLREATVHENRRNCATARGWRFDKRRVKRPYRAYLMVNGKSLSLGSHATSEAAREAYLQGTKKYFGEFSVTNRPGVL